MRTRHAALATGLAWCLATSGAAQTGAPTARTERRGVEESGMEQSEKQQGVSYRSPGGTLLRLMLDDSNVGSEVTLGEITFPPNTDSGDHQHGAIEMFYIVSGELEHVVNGQSQILKPGMAGYVKPPDKVRHKTGPGGAKAVVVWVPGEEGKRVASRWKREP
ncbi:MAG: cupin domain-containing protein [Vicinamibacterales bacterium]